MHRTGMARAGAHSCRPRTGSGLPDEAGADGRSLSRRLEQQRHHRPGARAAPERSLGQQVLVENRPGAGGNVGSEFGRESAPGRLHAARRDQRPAGHRAARLQAGLRHSARPRARGAGSGRALHARRASVAAGEEREANSSRWQRRGPGSCCSRPRAMRARRTCAGSCSSRWRRSTSCTCPTRAARRP